MTFGQFISRVLDIFEAHFAVMTLAIIFFGGAFMLSHYGMHEETSRWIEGGPTIIALVAILKNSGGVSNGSPPPPTGGTT